jgi:predicted nucleic acid-binding protein
LRPAFVDTSVLVALELREAGWERLRTDLRPFDELHASDLLAAEFLATARREGLPADQSEAALRRIKLSHPPRSLKPEIDRVLVHGYLRGADVWHLACALFLAPDPAELPFLTRDARQAEVARALGFRAN